MLHLESKLKDLPQTASLLIESCKDFKIWLFDAEMGTGKTTLIAEICKKLGVTSAVQSPTFSIVNEYQTADNQAVYHFDCYRLKNTNEAYDIGLEEYLYSGNYCFIEWPELIIDLIDEAYCTIKIEKKDEESREISILPTIL